MNPKPTRLQCGSRVWKNICPHVVVSQLGPVAKARKASPKYEFQRIFLFLLGYPSGNEHIPSWENKHCLQSVLAKGYVRFQEGNFQFPSLPSGA